MRSTGQCEIYIFLRQLGQALCGGLLPPSLEDFEIAIDEGASRARGWRIHPCARKTWLILQAERSLSCSCPFNR